MPNYNFRTTICCFLLVTNITCVIAQSENIERKVFLDVENLMGGDISAIFNNVEYIPLVSSKLSMINNCAGLIATPNGYVVLSTDVENNYGALVFFSIKGNFLKRISNLTGMKISKQGFENIWFDNTSSRIISLTSVEDKRILTYFDLAGNLLKTQKIQTNKSINYIGNGIYYTHQGFKENNMSDSESKFHVNFYSDNVYKGGFLPIDTAVNLYGPDNLVSSWPGFDVNSRSVLYPINGAYKIYNVDTNGIRETFNILFPLKYSLPVNFMSDKKLEGKRFQFTKQNANAIFGFNRIHKTKDFLFMSAMLWSSKWYSIMYNIKSETAYDLERIRPDSSNYYLPLYSNEGILFSDDEAIYSIISSEDMFNAKKDNSAKKIDYDTGLKSFFKKSSRISNPVLVRITLKD